MDLHTHTHTHAHILVCQILFSLPGNMCSCRMERSHLHPPCIFSPGSKLLGKFPKEKKNQSYRATVPHGYPGSNLVPVVAFLLLNCCNLNAISIAFNDNICAL